MSQNLLVSSVPSVAAVFSEYGQDAWTAITEYADQFEEMGLPQFEDDLAGWLANSQKDSDGFKPRLRVVKAKRQPLGEPLGDAWKIHREDDEQRQRCLNQPVFHQAWGNGYARVIVTYTERMLQLWSAGEVRDIHDEMSRLTAKIVMAIMFDLDVTDREAEHIAHTLDQVIVGLDNSRMAGSLAIGPDQNGQNAIALLDTLIYTLIDCRRDQGGGGDDLLSLLMQVHNVENDSSLSDQPVRDDVVTLMLAGYTTTANALSWIWQLLRQHPQIYCELMAELKTVLQGQAPAIAHLPQLTHTRWVIEEAMRIYPSVPDLIGETTQAWQGERNGISPDLTPIGRQPMVPHHAQGSAAPHHLPPAYQQDLIAQHLPYHLTCPTNDGGQLGVGRRFAVMEGVLILATIAPKFHLNLGPNPEMAHQPAITLQLKRDIQVELLAA